ncbi:uncharacterized protein METZ01_LOCUS480471 [marine metagenome]|uniref:Uncharacterized protein n=1 Tax=marine metagenome TaxID=408172 RepID=A0A383C5D2_9ZZZZ
MSSIADFNQITAQLGRHWTLNNPADGNQASIGEGVLKQTNQCRMSGRTIQRASNWPLPISLRTPPRRQTGMGRRGQPGGRRWGTDQEKSSAAYQLAH